MTYPVAGSSCHQPEQRPTDHKITAQRFIAVRFSDYAAILSMRMDLCDCIARVCMRVHIDQPGVCHFSVSMSDQDQNPCNSTTATDLFLYYSVLLCGTLHNCCYKVDKGNV